MIVVAIFGDADGLGPVSGFRVIESKLPPPLSLSLLSLSSFSCLVNFHLTH